MSDVLIEGTSPAKLSFAIPTVFTFLHIPRRVISLRYGICDQEGSLRNTFIVGGAKSGKDSDDIWPFVVDFVSASGAPSQPESKSGAIYALFALGR